MEVWIAVVYAPDEETLYGTHVFEWDAAGSLIEQTADLMGFSVNKEEQDERGMEFMEAIDIKDRVRLRARRVTAKVEAALPTDKGADI